MIEESEYCSKMIKIEFDKSFFMVEKDHEDIENPQKYWICKKIYIKKVR